MGRPKDIESFEAFAVKDITVYVAREVLQSELKENSLDFYIEGYGKYKLEVLE
jgi:hypothetical protein